MAKTSSNSQTPVGQSNNVLRVGMHELDLILDFVYKSRLPICIWGVKAVGKTTRIYDTARERGYRLEVLHLATQDIVDLIGMMEKVPEDKDAQKLHSLFNDSCNGKDLNQEEIDWIKNTMLNGKKKTVWTRPAWLHSDDDIPTVYFLDEMNRGNKFVSAAMLPFLLEGRMHQHQIGKNDVVIAACNPSTGKYSVSDAFAHDEALKDRCGHVILEPTQSEFMNYASKKLGPITMSVLNKHPKFSDIDTFVLPFNVEPSRRSLINVMSILEQQPKNWIRKHGKHVVPCYLGCEFGSLFWDSYFKKDEYLEIEDIMNIRTNQASRQKIEDAIIAVVNGKETVKNDIYEASLDTIVSYFAKSYKDGATNIEWLIDYFGMECVPKDSIVATLSKIDMLNAPDLCAKFMDSGLLNQLPELESYHAFNKLCNEGK